MRFLSSRTHRVPGAFEASLATHAVPDRLRAPDAARRA